MKTTSKDVNNQTKSRNRRNEEKPQRKSKKPNETKRRKPKGEENVHVYRMRGRVAYKVNDSKGSRVDYIYTLLEDGQRERRRKEAARYAIIPKESERIDSDIIASLPPLQCPTRSHSPHQGYRVHSPGPQPYPYPYPHAQPRSASSQD